MFREMVIFNQNKEGVLAIGSEKSAMYLSKLDPSTSAPFEIPTYLCTPLSPTLCGPVQETKVNGHMACQSS